MLCMNQGPVLSLLLWEISCTGYRGSTAYCHLFDYCKTMQYTHFQNREICFPDDTPSRKEEDGGHGLQTGPLHTTTIDGQGRGGVRGHIHLPRRGSSTLSGQALHRSDPRCTATQWTNLSVLRSWERWNQEANSGAVVERSHSAKFIALWEPDRVGTEKGWDLETLYWLSGAKQDHCSE